MILCASENAASAKADASAKNVASLADAAVSAALALVFACDLREPIHSTGRTSLPLWLVHRVSDQKENGMVNTPRTRNYGPRPKHVLHPDVPSGYTPSRGANRSGFWGTNPRPPYAHPERFILLAETITRKLPPNERELVTNTLLRVWGIR